MPRSRDNAEAEWPGAGETPGGTARLAYVEGNEANPHERRSAICPRPALTRAAIDGPVMCGEREALKPAPPAEDDADDAQEGK